MPTACFGVFLHQVFPLAIVDRTVYARTRRSNAPASLRLAEGMEIPLRRLGETKMLADHGSRLTRSITEQIDRQAFQAKLGVGEFDAFVTFVKYITPGFLDRDWKASWDRRPELHAPNPPPSARDAAIGEARDPILALLPDPSIWLNAGIRHLRPGSAPADRDEVRIGQASYAATDGALATYTQIDAQWRVARAARAREAASLFMQRLMEALKPHRDGESIERDRADLLRDGSVAKGDLLFIGGASPFLGHIIPEHLNRALQRRIAGDFAVTTPLTVQGGGALGIHRKSAAGRWEPFRPSHGLCLGRAVEGAHIRDPLIRMAARLRWAAWRIAANGKFHEKG